MTEPTPFHPVQASAPALRTITARRVGRNVWDDVPNRVDLVFDGYCGFCTRSVRIIRRIDRHDRVNVFAVQAAGTHQRTGVSAEESVRTALGRLADRLPDRWGACDRALGGRRDRLPAAARRLEDPNRARPPRSAVPVDRGEPPSLPW